MEQMKASRGRLYTQDVECPLGHLEKFVGDGIKLWTAEQKTPQREPHWDSPDKVEQVQGFRVSYFVHPRKDGKNGIDVHLEAEKQDNATVLKADMWCTLERLADVVKVTYYVTDLSLRDEANEQFLGTWSEPRPARTFVGVKDLPYGATVEIDAIATAR